MDSKRRLTKKEISELGRLMEMRDPHLTGPMGASMSRVHGFLTSVLSGPIIMPSEWIPAVFGDDEDHPFETMEQAQRTMDLLMRFYNDVASRLSDGGSKYAILVDRSGQSPGTPDLADDWSTGYVMAIAFRQDEWKDAMEDPKLQEAFFPILEAANENSPHLNPFENPEHHGAMVDVLSKSAVEIYAWWRKRLLAPMAAGSQQPAHSGTVHRLAPKISANAPCACGSGKKFKRCCSPVRLV
jgi:uncharacterized protein